MSIPTDPLGTALVADILSVEGVADVYSPHGVLRRMPGLVASAVGTVAERRDVAVTANGGQVSIAARIATAAGSPTPETARRVADLLLAEAAAANATVNIQVARIH